MAQDGALPPRASSQSGFSLVEVVVGLALIAFAVALMPGALRLGSQAFSVRGERERLAEVDMALAAIEHRLEQAIPFVQRGRDGSLRLYFTGEAAMLEFVSASEGGPLGPGVYRYRVRSEPQSGGPSEASGPHIELSLFRGEEGRAGEATIAPVVHALAGPHTTLSFRYLAAPSPRAEPQWLESWTPVDSLPALVEITAQTRTSAGLHRRRVLVAPRLQLRP